MKRLGLILGMTVLVLALATTSVMGQDYDYVRVGAIQPLTGVGAPEGVPQQQGVIMAESHINEAGGVLGGEFDVVYEDSESAPDAAVAAYRKLIDVDEIPLLIGAWSSGVSLALADVSIEEEITQISTGSTSPEITYLEDDGFMFRTAPSDVGQAVALAKLADQKGYETASTIVVNNPYGIGIELCFVEAWESLGNEVVNTVRADTDQASYRSELDSAFEEDPDVVINAAYPVDVTVMMRQWYELGLGGNWLGAEVLKAPGLPEDLGYEVFGEVEGVATHAPPGEPQEIFEEEWEEHFEGEEMGAFSPHAYDATFTGALAIEYAETAEQEESYQIRDALREVTNPPGEEIYPGPDNFARAKELIAEGEDIQYEGASGPVNYDEHGDPVAFYDHWVVTEDLEFGVEDWFYPEELEEFREEIGFEVPVWW